MNTEKEIVKILENLLDCNITENNKSTDIRQFGADSLDIVQIVIDIERTFNISIKDSSFPEIFSVYSLTKLVELYYEEN